MSETPQELQGHSRCKDAIDQAMNERDLYKAALKKIENLDHDDECESDQGSRSGDCMDDHRCYCASRAARKGLQAELEAMILTFFNGDAAKTSLWFSSQNPTLGGISPTEMLKAGRYDRLLQWAKQQISENFQP